MMFAFTSDGNCLYFYFTSLSGVGAARFRDYVLNTCLSAIQSLYEENANYFLISNRFNSVIQCVTPTPLSVQKEARFESEQELLFFDKN